jgi:hypothetical protein
MIHFPFSKSPYPGKLSELDFQGLHVAPETLQTGITTNANSGRLPQTEGTALKKFMA